MINVQRFWRHYLYLSLECTNRMLSTVSGESAVRRSVTVHPAALNDRSLTALEAGIANTCRASVASLGNWWELSFHHSRMSRLDASARACTYAVTSSRSTRSLMSSSSSKSQTSIRCFFAAGAQLHRLTPHLLFLITSTKLIIWFCHNWPPRYRL